MGEDGQPGIRGPLPAEMPVSGTALVASSYIAGTAASLAVVLGGARAYFSRQRERWTSEGRLAQQNTAALDANTKAAQANTQAIAVLTTKLDSFAEETRTELTDHRLRIGRLEDLAEGPVHTRRRTPGDGGPPRGRTRLDDEDGRP
jgi:hypothetical protein